ncbi:MAG: dephospho-CoA kinase [Pseudomonadota bacterium]
MRILGLTGSIGMGKSTAAKFLRRLGVGVHDADGAVHHALARGGAAVPAIARAFPGAVVAGAVDRHKLGQLVFGDAQALARLEAIVHPLVRRSGEQFLVRRARRRQRVVALDVPLLFETGRERDYDAVVVVSAPAFLQAQRALRRAGMSVARLERIRERQMADRLKRRQADFVVMTGLSKRAALRALRAALRCVIKRRGRAWRPGYCRG